MGELSVVVLKRPCSCPNEFVYGQWIARHRLECKSWHDEPDNNDHGVRCG